MAHLFRQLHFAAATIEATPAKENFLPLRRTLFPMFSFYNSSAEMHTETVDKNIALKTNDAGQKDKAVKKNPPLAVILSWLLAKGNHIDKYCNLYLQRGFDVLTLQITPHQMLFPAAGTQVVANNLLEYLHQHSNHEKILVHAFSVGAYVFGEIMLKMKENSKYSEIGNRIVGIVLDSAADFEGIPKGFPRAVAKNPVTIRFLEWYIQTHLKVLKNVATKHYIKASQQFHNTFLHCPALMLVSENDFVGDPKSNSVVAKKWIDRGVDVSVKCWEKSGHVSHLHNHPEEYVAELDKFLKKTNLIK